jgi:2-polyprenyl-6-methoxyphenol hydroxylase-like FAD-dependent oxidoreductase
MANSNYSTKSNPAHNPGNFAAVTKPGWEHAIVIGSSIAGLTAASVLANYFEKVTVIERDASHQEPEFRKGVPQARHAHTLLPRGQAILEGLFPGLMGELLAQGAIPVRPSQDIAFYNEGKWQVPRSRDSEVNIACSRPMLEAAIYRRVSALSNVRFMDGYQVSGLMQDADRQQVTGVVLDTRGSKNGNYLRLQANLVVDASGRNSQAPHWLAQLGYTPPEEWRINSFVGYTTRMYEQPEDFADGWKTLYVRPNPPDGTRGGIVLPMEDGRWHVTLIGVARDYPPTDESEFLDFARSLPTSRLYDAIRNATPLGKPSGYRRTENRVRRYDKLPRYLDGFLVLGDAAYTLNPIYAQGMTAAALASRALNRSLQEQAHKDSLVGISRKFQKMLSLAVGSLWHSTVTKEWGWSETELADNTEEIYPDEDNDYYSSITQAFEGKKSNTSDYRIALSAA